MIGLFYVVLFEFSSFNCEMEGFYGVFLFFGFIYCVMFCFVYLILCFLGFVFIGILRLVFFSRFVVIGKYKCRWYLLYWGEVL